MFKNAFDAFFDTLSFQSSIVCSTLTLRAFFYQLFRFNTSRSRRNSIIRFSWFIIIIILSLYKLILIIILIFVCFSKLIYLSDFLIPAQICKVFLSFSNWIMVVIKPQSLCNFFFRFILKKRTSVEFFKTFSFFIFCRPSKILLLQNFSIQKTTGTIIKQKQISRAKALYSCQWGMRKAKTE